MICEGSSLWYSVIDKAWFFPLMQDPSLLECAWIELLEKNKRVTVEELAEVYFLSVAVKPSCSSNNLGSF